MSNSLILTTLLMLFAGLLGAESMEIPEEVLNEMELKEVKVNDIALKYKVVYPKGFDKDKKYAAVLACAGGAADESTVNYCYHTMFRSSYLENKILLMPIKPFGLPFNALNEEKITSLFDSLKKNEQNISDDKWIVAGTSNGGIGAFNILRYKATEFEGLITMPGGAQWLVEDPNEKAPENWRHLKILLAIGEKDNKMWKEVSSYTAELITKSVKNIAQYEMKDQGHIATPEYDIDQVYKEYFEMKNLTEEKEKKEKENKDKNGGKISRKTFKKFDEDKDGKLTLEEFKKLASGKKWEDEAEDFFKELDKNSDSKVTFKEIKQLGNKEMTIDLEWKDVNGDGKMDYQEFEQAAKGKPWEKVKKQVFKAIDKNNDGFLDKAECGKTEGENF